MPQYWDRILSGGEMQRLGFARLFYHTPVFAFMDESTSAMDIELEHALLQTCTDKGITMISIIHRMSSLYLHDKVLRFSEDTEAWSFTSTDPARVQEERGRIREELESTLARVRRMSATPLSDKDKDANVSMSGIPARVLSPRLGVRGIDDLFWSRFHAIRSLTFSSVTGESGRTLVLAFVIRGLSGLAIIAVSNILGKLTSQTVSENTDNYDRVDFWGNAPDKIGWLYGNCFFLFVVAGLATWHSLMLGLYVRGAIQQRLHKLYFKKKVAYAVNQVDDLVDTVDQRMTADVEFLTRALQLAFFGSPENPTQGRPGCIVGAAEMLGLFVYAFYLNVVVALNVLVWFCAAMVAYTYYGDDLGKATVPVQSNEGLLRYTHLRMRSFAESIAFYDGEKSEALHAERLLQQVYNSRVNQLYAWIPVLVTNNVFISGLSISILLLTNYCALFRPQDNISSDDYSAFLFFYIIFALRLGAYGSCCASSGVVVGLVHRVGELLECCGKYEHYAAEVAAATSPPGTGEGAALVGMDHVTVATPNGMALIPDLSFEVGPGGSLIVMGPSGCGKSSMLRVLTGLWKPSGGGRVTRPSKPGRGGFLFLPQKSYVTEGTFLEQVIYPDRDTGDLEAVVRAACGTAGLTKLVERYGLASERPWGQILSGGELQRLNFARLFYHRPAVVFMDEATSSLDEASEAYLATQAKACGVVFISVAHRQTLLQYHTDLLSFSCDGGAVTGVQKKLR